MTMATEEEKIAFVACVYCGATEGREPMTWKDAYINMLEWAKEGVEMPKGLTPRFFAKYWNEFCEEDGEE